MGGVFSGVAMARFFYEMPRDTVKPKANIEKKNQNKTASVAMVNHPMPIRKAVTVYPSQACAQAKA